MDRITTIHMMEKMKTNPVNRLNPVKTFFSAIAAGAPGAKAETENRFRFPIST